MLSLKMGCRNERELEGKEEDRRVISLHTF
jgi:hypothetical protein